METGNHFLDSLDPEDFGALQPYLEPVDIKRDQGLVEAGDRVTRVYLPIDSIISVVTLMRDGNLVESRTIGRESGFGLLHALGSDFSLEAVICQVGGQALVIGTALLADAAAGRPSLVKDIVRHAQASMVQSAQSTACNAMHDVRQRLCRWLLLTQDRLASDVLPLTQEHLSIMLGVARTTVTNVASELQVAGVIAYSRGKVTVLDRSSLLRLSCECYEAIEGAAEAFLEPSLRLRQ
jgi:CRP-like cAMP-binding protein